MDYRKNCNLEFENFKRNNINFDLLSQNKKTYIKRIFKRIYLLNLLKNSPALSTLKNNDYFKNSFSCIIESFDLLVSNHIRASYLILRSSMESYLKCIINILVSTKPHNSSFKENKNIILEHISKSPYYNNIFSFEKNITNLGSLYGDFSALTHSDTSLIENFSANYLLEIRNVSESSFECCANRFLSVLELFIKILFPVFIDSFKQWNSLVLKDILSVTFSKSEVNDILTSISNYNNFLKTQ